MNSYDLAGRIAVITGGASGIGAATAALMRRSGAQVAVWDTAEGQEAAFYRCVDVSDAAQVEAAARETELALGRIDILVCSAGIAGPIAPLQDTPPAQWRKVMAVNLDGTFHCCRSVLPGMIARNYGRIVNIASIAGKEGNPNASAYSASKAGVIALTKSLGKEVATQDIAVNCITPATAQTRILEQVTPEFIAYMRSKIPRGRFVTVDEIATMVAWLCSAENSFTTGAVFDLSGGRATY